MLSMSRSSTITPCQYYAYEPIICSFTEMWGYICSTGYGESFCLSGRGRGNYLGAYIAVLCAWVIIGRNSGKHEGCYCLPWMNKQSDEMGLLTDGARTTLMSMHRFAHTPKPMKSITRHSSAPLPAPPSTTKQSITQVNAAFVCAFSLL